MTGHAHHHLAAAGHVAALTRARFALPADARVAVHEHPGTEPGVPLATHVTFWTGAARHEFSVFKPAAEVVESDLPPAFMKRALVASEDKPCC